MGKKETGMRKALLFLVHVILICYNTKQGPRESWVKTAGQNTVPDSRFLCTAPVGITQSKGLLEGFRELMPEKFLAPSP